MWQYLPHDVAFINDERVFNQANSSARKEGLLEKDIDGRNASVHLGDSI